MRRLLAVLMTVLVANLGLTLLAPAAQAAPGFAVTYESIPGDGGDLLKGFVVTPTGQGPGPFPVLVMPSSWATPNLEYVAVGAKLARERGYIVISYASRGFYESGGLNDVAGPATINDVSRVIDWALARTPADPAKIGAVGISYGAGASLLAAAQEPRIKAVSALSAWTDLLASLNPNDTVSAQAAAILLISGNITSRPGPVLRKAQADLLNGDIDAIKPIGPVRSAATKLDRINANGAAIMIANQWDDALFPPSQITDFYTRLTGPKRLLLAPGDHGTAEIPGLIGVSNASWDTTARWMDHHLKGVANGIDRENPVNLKDKQTGAWRTYADWAAASRATTLYLSDPHWLTGFGDLDTRSRTGWRKTIFAGVPTLANSGIAVLTGALQGYLGIPPLVSTPLVDKNAAGVWSSDDYSGDTLVQGAPKLHTTVTPSARDTSLFAYLYDVDAFGFGKLITHKPFTLLNATPGQARTLDLQLEPTSWTVPRGHHLTLVVDTVDLRYQGKSSLGHTLTFSSPSGSPSTLTVPTG
ncbi:CocE/NonD family hydrolase [Actinokineospora sp.]|uniref:CocE/NonD family hydrolase n=1 Tax=Actinokineospora sp. TaxID=1872133 RepID=UPI004038488C